MLRLSSAWSRAFSVRSVGAHRALLRDQDNRAVQYMLTKRFVDGLSKANSIEQLMAAVAGHDPATMIPKHVSLMAYKIGKLQKTEGKTEDDALQAAAVSLINKSGFTDFVRDRSTNYIEET